MSKTPPSPFLGMPTTGAGRWSVRLALGFLVLFPAWLGYTQLRPIPRPTFFSDPLHAFLLLSAALSAVGGGLVGIWAMLREGERSILVLLCVLLAGLVAWWGGAEILNPH